LIFSLIVYQLEISLHPREAYTAEMRIIEYMNANYALKQMDTHFYPATSSFGIRILSSDICILYDIRLLVPWLGHSKVFCIVLF
jgi:hypothetical protein